MLIRTFYVSEIAPGLTETDIRVILGVAQVNNRRLDVTGMLAQSDGHFAQVLEGRTEVVPELLERIGADRRHSAVRVLLQESVVTRQFSRWSMGLVRRDDMADEMRAAHQQGCANRAEARRLIEVLLRPPGQ